jgi:acyl transferase domain-containing protein
MPSAAAASAPPAPAAASMARAPGPTAGPVPPAAVHPPQLAVTGFSLRAAQVSSVAGLHAAMRDGAELHSAAPFARWDVDAVYRPGGAGGVAAAAGAGVSTRWGTFVADVHTFDASAFGLGPSEAAVMDPQARLLLEHTAAAALESGRSAHALSGAAGGVFVGCIWLEHAQLMAHHRAAPSASLVTGGRRCLHRDGRLGMRLACWERQ